MAKNQGSVRMGPISLFTLVIVLCLAVLAVLAVTTANASYVMAERQAAAAHATYSGECAAQELVASVDAALASVRQTDVSAEAVTRAVDEALPGAVEASQRAVAGVAVRATLLSAQDAVAAAGVADSVDAARLCGGVKADFATESGQGLTVVLGLRANGTYQVLSWKTTATLEEEGSGDVLWSGGLASQ